jgi:hyperosmotically inducible protein
MKPLGTSSTLTLVAVLVAMLMMTACKREERAATPPEAPAAAPGSPVPTPPNPPSVVGTAPKSPAAPAPGPAERAGRAIGEQLDDATLTAKVKAALLQAPDVKGMQINVDSDRGAVQLSGFVESQAQIDKAVQLAKGVNGVREVHDKMTIKAAKESAAPAKP